MSDTDIYYPKYTMQNDYLGITASIIHGGAVFLLCAGIFVATGSMIAFIMTYTLPLMLFRFWMHTDEFLDFSATEAIAACLDTANHRRAA